MLQFSQAASNATIILTLTELVTVPVPYFLFVFTHVTTKEVVSFVKSEAEDTSDYPDRYNQFTIDAQSLFDGKQPGEWHYKVYEQEDADNTDIPEDGEGLLEAGKLLLNRSDEFEYTMYQHGTTYKTYNG
jgi:hypothetical protein